MSATSRGAGSRSGAQPGQSITVSNFDSSTSEPEVGLASLKAGVEEKEKEKGHPGASETKGSPQPAVPTTNSEDSERKNSSDFFGGGDGDLDRDDSDGSQVEVAFVQRLRAEKRFPDPASLVAQIRRDADQAGALLEAGSPP